jgi:formiminoglutamase
LYLLAFHFGNLKIADLGNVRKAEENFVAPLVQELLDGGVAPVLIGGADRLMLSQFFAHKAVQSSVNLCLVDEKIRYAPADGAVTFLNEILQPRNSDVFHLSLLGFQMHFADPDALADLENRHFDLVRLGKARSAMADSEPLIRDADFLGFHLSALKYGEAPAQTAPTPNGFYAEEACQISRYAGFSDKMKSFGIYGYQPEKDADGMTAQVIAQMVWYFIDGFYNRKGDFPASTDGMVEYVVDAKGFDQHIVFWKSTKSGRWWAQVPVKTKKAQSRHRLVPCTFDDYQQTSDGELPQRLWNAFQRFD